MNLSHFLNTSLVAFSLTVVSFCPTFASSSHGNSPAQNDATAADVFAPNYAKSPEVKRLLHWAHLPVHVYFDAENSTEDKAAMQAHLKLVRAGFDEWVGASGGVIHYSVVKSMDDADIIVTLVHDTYVPSMGSAVGNTIVTYSGDVLKKATMVLASGTATAGEMQSVAAHEFGHALGISGHSQNAGDLMYAVEYRTSHLTSDAEVNPSPDEDAAHGVTDSDMNTMKVCYRDLFKSMASR